MTRAARRSVFGNGKGQIVHRDDRSAAEEPLPPRRHEVGREDHVIAVEQTEYGFDQVPQEPQRGSDGKEKAIRDLMGTKSHLSIAGHRWRLLPRCEKGVCVEIEPEPVIAPIKGGEEVPLVPTDTGHRLGEGEDVDTHDHLVGAVDDPVIGPTYACPQGSREIAPHVAEEARRRSNGTGHGGASYTSPHFSQPPEWY